jgi:hypothetical protein
MRLITNDLISAVPLSDPHTERPKKTFQVIIERSVNDTVDLQHYFAYILFKSAIYVISRFVNSCPCVIDNTCIEVYEVTCTYRSMEEVTDYQAYGDADEDND